MADSTSATSAHVISEERKFETTACANSADHVNTSHESTSKVVFREVTKPTPPNFFGRIRERNLAFCIDTSGSMYQSLNAVKQHLIEFLFNLAQHPLPTRFNLIEFSTEIKQWSNELVTCTPEVVSLASEWIKKLEAKTGTNTLGALEAAFSHGDCDAVVLVTDGLPDQSPHDLLDEISVISDNKPVHCYYIKNGFDPDGMAVEFLEDLAMETYGSFHIISLTQHGVLEKVTPMYRADMAGERIIRTSHGRVYPSTLKECRLTPTLDAPVDVVVESTGPEYIVDHRPGSLSHYHQYPDARYYYSYYYPYQGWSRYHPAKSWMKKADKIIEAATMNTLPPHVSPGAGAMLIGTKVLARRFEDGYFYKGTVKSQIFEQKFLVEFSPCRHGKYQEVSYQETFVYDILSLDDARRHAVIVGDKVLAPFEPNGDRYGPATVIEGQEARVSDSSASEDQDLVVSFEHDGRTLTMKKGAALWVPNPLHERIAFELKLPAKVRKELAMTEDYPLSTVPGYPKSGFQPYPPEYDRFEEVVVERDFGLPAEKGLYRAPYFVPLYPTQIKEKSKYEKSEVVPGTHLTKDELNEKVVQQLLEHKILLEEIKRDQGILRMRIDSDGKLLSKRDTINDNSLKKSVTFEDEGIRTETETRDSGHGSVTDDLSDLDLSDFEWEDESRSVAVGPDTPMIPPSRRRRRKMSGKLPPWKYWSTDPSPNLLESNNFGRYRTGPFRDCLLSAPLEAKQYGNNACSEEGGASCKVPKEIMIEISLGRGQKLGRYMSLPAPSITDLTPTVLKRIERDWEKGKGVTLYDWNETMYQVVNSRGEGVNNPTVRDSLGYYPRPPPAKPENQRPGVDISIQLGNEEKFAQVAAARDARRRRVIERERVWEKTVSERETMKEAMHDQHRAAVLNQIKKDWQRAKDDQERMRMSRESKKAISADIRARIDAKQVWEQDRELRRTEGLQARRERQVRIKDDHAREVQDTLNRRQAVKEQNKMRYWAGVNDQRLEREAQQAQQDAAKRAAQAKRIEHFRQLEEDGQAKKRLQNQVLDQRNAMMRSSIFS